MNHTCAIILAAGEGTRMKSGCPKVLSTVLFKPMLEWVINAVKNSGIEEICVVTGFKHELVDEYLREKYNSVYTVLQTERKGTAHAVMMANDFLERNVNKDVIILGGDSPFIDYETITESYQLHKREGNSATVISAKVANPYGYGRVVRNDVDGNLKEIIEQKDASSEIKKINEVSSGVYWFNVQVLNSVLRNITNHNAQGEYYLPDAIKLIMSKGLNVNSFVAKNSDIVLGANDCEQLNQLNEIARKRVLSNFMKAGLNIPCTDGVLIGEDVKFGLNTKILPGTIIDGYTELGSNCVIGPNSFIQNSTIGNNVTLNSVYCFNQVIPDDKIIKPFTVLKDNEV